MSDKKITITKIFNPLIGFMIEMLYIFLLIISAVVIATFIWYLR